jgi:hypothetical protein
MSVSLLWELVSDYAYGIVRETHFRNIFVFCSMPQAIKLIELYYFDTSFYMRT